ncbi:GTP-binding protein HflX [Pyrobaculum oguniense TE7]|uniref:GTPase HflX n=1 Tax=Pyrobaculum oguniense (strain DSM 13380 / JCM 10595 / TE7) TaxID=698757 RepID=H6QDL0_PYROT|nr:GTP-binding protein HflX [Pyrobaculum oguniense TE7]
MRNKALLAYSGPKTPNLVYKLEEFASLVEVAGFEVSELVTQYGRADSRFYLGAGKAREVASKDFDIFIAYHSLTPLQVFNLERLFKRRVVDRVFVILVIFERRAGSIESKLQIELARLRYELPKVKEYLRRAKMGEQLGFLGAGEYVIDSYYRHMVRRISSIKKRLEEAKKGRIMHIKKRKEAGVPEVVLTGYTSAGKTTLFNRLVSENKIVDGRPFATLETYSRALDIWGKRVVLTDTIGFIDDLPPVLIESFHSTLQEIIDADRILLVIDGSEPYEEVARKISTSVRTLGEVGVDRSKIIPIVNKVDKIRLEELRNLRKVLEKYFTWFVPVSALTGFGIEALKAVLFFQVPGYTIVRASGDGNPVGLRVGDVVFVPVKE